MANNLKMEVILQAIDRATRPIRAITQGSVGLGRALKESRDQLKAMQAQQRDISSWRTLRTAAGQTEQSLQQARDRVKELGRQMAATGAPTRQMQRDLQGAIRAATNLKREHQEQQTQLQGLRNKLNAAGISTRNLSTHERELRGRIEHTNKSIADQTKRMQALTQQSKRLAQARAQYDKTQQLAGSMAGSGAAGLASGSGILYGLRSVLAPGLEFDTTMSKVQALTNLDKADEQLDAIRAQARKLGAETMFSATDAAQGQAFLAMAGFTPKNIMAAMPGLLDMAKAGDMDLGRTADIASNILGGFRIDPSEMGRMADVLTKAFTTSNMNLEMLGDTMSYVGPVAATAGMSLEEAAAMAGLLGNVGIQATKSGTTLRAMLLRLSAPLGPAQKAMEKLGISAKDSEGNVRNITTVLGEVAKATEKMGTGDRLEYFKAIFGEEPAAGMAELIQQAGAGGILKYLEVVENSAGAAGKTAKIMADNLTGDLDELFSGLDEVRIELFDQQNGALREFVQGLTEMVGRLGVWVKENPKLTAQILKMVAGLGLIMATMGGLTLMLASILGPFAMVRYGMMLLGIKSLGAVTALKAVGTALLWLGRLALLNPIGLLITAVALIYTYWEPISEFFLGLWSQVKAAFDGGIVDVIALLISWNPLILFRNAFNGVLDFFGIELPGKFTGFGGMLIDGLIVGIKNAFPGVTSLLGKLAAHIPEPIRKALGIHSPSRVFAELGGFTMQGLEKGLLGGQGGPLDAVLGLGKQLAAAGAITFGAAGSAIAMDNRPPLGSQSAPRAAQVQPLPPIVINVHPTPGMDEQRLANLVAIEVAKIQRAQQARNRSALSDQE